MSRDLPLDADAGDTGDHAGDAAYRVATGVARVARAGAYVMGGALIASGSDDGPAIGDSQDESRVAGWSVSSVRDPQPNAPSPVITYPDPRPDPGHQPAPSPNGEPIPPGFWVHIEINAGPDADTHVPG